MYRTLTVTSNSIFQNGCFIGDAQNSFDMFDLYANQCFVISRFVVDEIIFVVQSEWQSLLSNLQTERPYLSNRGGYDSTFLIEGQFWELSQKEHQSFMNGLYRECVAVVQGEDTNINYESACFIIDPQGTGMPKYINPFGKWILPYLKFD